MSGLFAKAAVCASHRGLSGLRGFAVMAGLLAGSHLLTSEVVAQIAPQTPQAAAQAQQGQPQTQAAPRAAQIRQIQVGGNQRIERGSVISLSGLRVGASADQDSLNQAVKSLYASGLFNDVQVSEAGGIVSIRLVESPIINQVAFEGNYTVDDEVLGAETRLASRDVLTSAKVKADVSRVLSVYRASGMYDVDIRPVTIPLRQNRVNLVYEITEGPKSKIKSIQFIGNRSYSDRRLRREIISRQDAFWRFISGVTGYDPDRIRFDEELLRGFYRDRGYADMEVRSSIGEFRENDRGFSVTMVVDEGPRYRIGAINVNNSIPGVSADDLRKLATFRPGSVYDASEVQATVAAITDALGDQGYAFVDIEPELDRQRGENGRRVDVTFVIDEAEKVFVERINITGNLQTLDKVVRREADLVEGDAFSVTKIRDSRRSIEGLGYFSRVDVTNRPGSTPDKTIIDIEVEEQTTGALEFGGAYSSAGGPSLSFGLSQDNLLGRGTAIDIDVTASETDRNATVSLTEPYLFDRNMTGGVDMSYSDREVSSSGYSELALSGGVRWGYRVNKHLTQNWGLGLRFSDIDPGTTTTLAITDEAGETLRANATHSLTYARLDSFIAPRSGFRVSLNNEYAGFGADIDYIKNSLTLDAYVPIGDNITIASRTRGGVLNMLSGNARIGDRFTLGGAQVRGFSASGIGPRVASTNESLGGSNFYYTNLEARADIPLPFDLEIEARAFVDAGSTWDIQSNYTNTVQCDSTGGIPSGSTATACYNDGHAIRASAGIGMRWDSPLGPLQLDYGIPFQSEDYDIIERFRFNIGTRF